MRSCLISARPPGILVILTAPPALPHPVPRSRRNSDESPRSPKPRSSLVLVWFLAGLAWAETRKPFSVVLLPDTQNYSAKNPETYVAQTTWIANQAKPRNIQFVIHLGDIVDDGKVETMWQVADRAHRVLDGVVPYSVLPGNHDMCQDEYNTTLYNKYFSPKRFDKCPWYGGHEGTTNDNNFCEFEAGGMKFLVVSLQHDPSDRTLDWARKVIDARPDRRVIVATHSYLMAKDRTPMGERIWEKLVRSRPNIFMVVCGHVGASKLQTSRNASGGLVYELLTDYQRLPNGGDGWLRVLEFRPDENRISINSLSPTQKTTQANAKELYSLDYDMTPKAVASGQRPVVGKRTPLRCRRGR